MESETQASARRRVAALLSTNLIRRGARHYAGRVAVRYRDEQLTYAQVDEWSNRIANSLIAFGLHPQECVGLLVNNSLFSVPLDFACMKARLIRVPLNSRLSATEQSRMLEELDVRVLVHGADLTERAMELRSMTTKVQLDTICVGPGAPVDLESLMAQASPNDPALPTPDEDIVLALFTSGTTGTLKAAQHTQRSWTAICINILANLVNPDSDAVMLHSASLIHASGLFVLPFWVRGAQSVVLDGFDANTYLDQAARYGATHANVVPTMLTMLVSDEKRFGKGAGSLTSVIYGASPMPRPTIESALDMWGPIFTQYYGQTEAPLAIATLSPRDHVGIAAPLGACGQPAVDVDVRVIDETGDDVASGATGEIAVRGPMVHAGYRNAPELDNETRMARGFIRTRDLGHFDDDGFLYLADRTSEMIISGGYNVYPREVETAVEAHPAVMECAVVGAPDEKWVEVVTAFIVERPGQHVSDDALVAFVRQRLAGYKVPRRIERRETLPKSAVGKVLRRTLRDLLWDRQ